jgi:hypothetical protein
MPVGAAQRSTLRRRRTRQEPGPHTTIAELLIVVGVAFFAVCIAAGAWRRFAPVIAARRQAQIDEAVQRALNECLVREVRPWVKADVQREIAKQKAGSQRLAATLQDAAAATAAQDTKSVAEAALRLALNELLEELEYILGRVEDNDPAYWHAYQLPNDKWVAHAATIGATDNRAHAALRAAYREAGWADPVLRSTCCESRAGVVPSTLGEAADGILPGGEPEGEPSGGIPSARVRAAGGQAAGAGSVQAAAKTAGALRPRAECGRCWLKSSRQSSMTTRASARQENSSRFSSSSRTREWKDSTNGFCHGAPGSM